MSEMYAMLIEREAKRIFKLGDFEKENKELEKQLDVLKIESNENTEKILKDPHTIGKLIVKILEEQFPNFSERKSFVKSVLSRKGLNS